MLTAEELALCTSIGELVRRFGALDQMHPSDEDEFRAAAHTMQLIMIARSAQREHPDELPSFVKVKGAWMRR